MKGRLLQDITTPDPITYNPEVGTEHADKHASPTRMASSQGTNTWIYASTLGSAAVILCLVLIVCLIKHIQNGYVTVSISKCEHVHVEVETRFHIM